LFKKQFFENKNFMKKFFNNPKNNYQSRYTGNWPTRSSPRPQPRRILGEAEARFFAGTAIDPSPRIRLEDGLPELTMRVMDLICPVGMGQRGLIVAPPGSGKTTLLKHICQAVAKSSPEMKRYCLLIDERPEEVTDFRRNISAEVRWSSSPRGDSE
jgi:flagellar biosynthesis/type III secretory pathway ATPase